MIIEIQLQFQPLRSPDDREYQKKEGEPPSTAIDIGALILIWFDENLQY